MDTHTARFPQALKHFPLLLVFFFSLFFLPFYLSIDIFLVITHNAEGRTDGQRGGERPVCFIWRETHQTVQIGIAPYANQWRKAWWRQRRDVSSWPFDNQDFQPFFFLLSDFSPQHIRIEKRCMEKKDEGKKMCRLYLVVVGPKTTTTPSPERMKGEKTRENVKGGRKEKEPKSLHLFLSATIQHQSIFRCKTRWAPTGLIRLCSQRSPKVYYNNTTRRRNSSTGGHSIRPFSSQSLSTALNVFLARCSPKGASACSLDDPPAEI